MFYFGWDLQLLLEYAEYLKCVVQMYMLSQILLQISEPKLDISEIRFDTTFLWKLESFSFQWGQTGQVPKADNDFAAWRTMKPKHVIIQATGSCWRWMKCKIKHKIL